MRILPTVKRGGERVTEVGCGRKKSKRGKGERKDEGTSVREAYVRQMQSNQEKRKGNGDMQQDSVAQAASGLRGSEERVRARLSFMERA